MRSSWKKRKWEKMFGSSSDRSKCQTLPIPIIENDKKNHEVYNEIKNSEVIFQYFWAK